VGLTILPTTADLKLGNYSGMSLWLPLPAERYTQICLDLGGTGNLFNDLESQVLSTTG